MYFLGTNIVPTCANSMANDVLRADAPRFAELISDAANDMSWAGAHVFAILSHAGMMLAGVICFIFSPASSDDIVRGRVPFGIASTLPSVTGMLVSNIDDHHAANILIQKRRA